MRTPFRRLPFRICLVRLIGFWVTCRNFGTCNASDNMRFVDTLPAVIRIANVECLNILYFPEPLTGAWGATGCLANDRERFYRC